MSSSQAQALRPARRRWAKPLAFVGVAVGILLATASPAFAHAEFVSSTPEPGSQVTKAPPELVLRFSEGVTAESNSVQLFDSDAEQIDLGDLGREDGNSSTISVGLPDLQEGTYAVTYRVVSADSHPITGSFSFAVGNAAVDASSSEFARGILADQGSDSGLVKTVYAIVRALVFAALAIFVGATAFVVGAWPEGWASARVRRLIGWSWVVAFVSTLLGIGFQGAYTSGGTLADVFAPSVIGDVIDTRFGKAWLARAVLLLLAVPVVLALKRASSRKGPLPWVALAIAAGIMLTPGVAGHASTGRWVALAMPADTLHLLAIAAWFGGLTVLAIEVLRSDDIDAVEPAVDRFARIGFVAVGVIVATGLFQSYRQLAQFSDLWETAYGRLLLVKLGAFAALMVVASASRDIVRFEIRREGRREQLSSPLPAGPGAMRAAPDLDDPADTVRRLRSAVWYEVAFAIAILAVTALLVNEAPARATPTSEPLETTLSTDDGAVNFEVSVTPSSVGQNQMHITALKPTGEIMPLVDLTATLSAPDKDVAPMDVQLVRVGGGSHYQSTGLSIPFKGTWEVEITGLVSDVDEVTVSSDFEVGG